MFPSVTFRNLPNELKWETMTVPRGESIEGCIVGPVIEANTHFVGLPGRKPADRGCVAWATQGKLECDHCKVHMRVLARGYLPVLGKLNEKWVVILSETVLRQIKDMKQGTPIRFTRPKKGKRPLSVTLLNEYDLGEKFVKTCKQLHPFELFAYVLHLWQDERLNHHFDVEYHPAMKAPPEPVAAA
jgi:hypothetical protein